MMRLLKKLKGCLFCLIVLTTISGCGKKLVTQQKKSEDIGSKQYVIEMARNDVETEIQESKEEECGEDDKLPVVENRMHPLINIHRSDEGVEHAYEWIPEELTNELSNAFIEETLDDFFMEYEIDYQELSDEEVEPYLERETYLYAFTEMEEGDFKWYEVTLDYYDYIVVEVDDWVYAFAISNRGIPLGTGEVYFVEWGDRCYIMLVRDDRIKIYFFHIAVYGAAATIEKTSSTSVEVKRFELEEHSK